MYQGKKIKAIVLAGGSGRRMEAEVSKQYLQIHRKPMLYYSLAAFEASPVDGIVLVTGPGEEAYCRKEIIEKYHLKKVECIVPGGAERYHSSASGLKAAGECDYVLIHDAARPCLTQEIICGCIETVIKNGACTAGVKTIDTISRADEQGKILDIPDRNYLWVVQTPQCFCYADISKAHQMLADVEPRMTQPERAAITDDVRIVQHFLGMEVYMADGSYENIKVTTPADLKTAEIFLKNH